MNTTIAALKGVLQAAFQMELLPADAYLRLRSVKRLPGRQDAGAGRALSRAEVARMRRASQHSPSIVACRNAALIDLMLFAGLRRSEVTAPRLADNAPHSSVLVVRRGKGNTSRYLTLPPPARDTLRRRLARRGAAEGALVCRVDPRIDPTSSLSTQRLYTIVQERSRLAGLPACSRAICAEPL